MDFVDKDGNLNQFVSEIETDYCVKSAARIINQRPRDKRRPFRWPMKSNLPFVVHFKKKGFLREITLFLETNEIKTARCIISAMNWKTGQYEVISDEPIDQPNTESLTLNYSVSDEHQLIWTSQLRIVFACEKYVNEKMCISGICLKTSMDYPINHEIKINRIFLKDHLFSDFTIIIKSNQKKYCFPTHKLLLCEHSSYFKDALLSSPNLKEFELTADVKYFNLIYEYLYTKNIQFQKENTYDIMIITRKYKFDALYQQLFDQFLIDISMDEFFELLVKYESLDFEFFIRSSLTYIVQNEKFTKVAKKFLDYLIVNINDWKPIDKDSKEKYLSLLDKFVKSQQEKELFQLFDKLSKRINEKVTSS
eukprot:gene4052-7341_t